MFVVPRSIVAFLVFSMIACSAIPQVKPTLDEQLNISMYQKMKPNVCRVNIYSADPEKKDDSLMGHGTGFLMTENGTTWIVTAAHVAMAGPNIELRVKFGAGPEYKVEIVKCGDPDGTGSRDVAFLSLPKGFMAPKGLSLAKNNAEIGSSAWILGYPLDYELLFGIGFVSGYNTQDGLDGIMDVSTGIIWGNSGGCIVDRNGDVIGVAVHMANGHEQAFPYLGECVTVEQIRAMLPPIKTKAVQKPLYGPTDFFNWDGKWVIACKMVNFGIKSSDFDHFEGDRLHFEPRCNEKLLF
jgi:S1-C subfamily serine protease